MMVLRIQPFNYVINMLKKDTRVKTYHKKNGGLSDARNYGLERISGKYVTFIDSDDYIDDNYLKYMYDLILKENAQICMVQGQLLLENEEPHKFPINVEKCGKYRRSN